MSLVLPTSLKDGKLHVTVPIARLDASVTRDFKAGMEAAWQAGTSEVEIDLAGVEFVDSSGVGALLSVYRRLSAGGGVLRLTGVKPGVRSMMELLRLNQFFVITG